MENAMRVRALPEDFNRAFEDNLGKFTRRKQAYEATEQLHEKLTGNRYYSDYESFRRSRTKRLKKR